MQKDKFERRAPVCVGILTLLTIAAMLVGCGSSSTTTSSSTVTHTPKFLVALDYTSGNNVNVFSVNLTTGALTQVSGSPFNVGLAGPAAIVTHPTNGSWVYVCHGSQAHSNEVMALLISATGTPSVTTSTTTATSNGCYWSVGHCPDRHLAASTYTQPIMIAP